MRRVLTGVLLLFALVVIAAPVQAGEVEDLERMVEELEKEVAELRADRALGANSVERVVDDYLTRRAAGEGAGDLAGYRDGEFGLGSEEGDFDLTIGGGIAFDLRIYECDGMQDNTFDIELVRIKLEGRVFDDWTFRLQPEFSTSGVILRDAFIQSNLWGLLGGTSDGFFGGLDLRFGQFKMPFSMGQLENPYHIDMIHLPLIVNYLAPGWDVGLQLSSTMFNGALTYALAMSNGTNGVNNSDEFWGWFRVIGAPFVGHDDGSIVRNLQFGLNFGLSHVTTGTTPAIVHHGGGPYGEVGKTDDTTYGSVYPVVNLDGRQMLGGVELLWWWRQFAFKAECLAASFEVEEEPDESVTEGTTLLSGSSLRSVTLGPDDHVVMYGGYAQFAYMITGEDWSEAPSSGLEGVLRFDYAQVDWGGGTDEGDIMAFSLGLNYHFNKDIRLMLNYVVTDFGSTDFGGGDLRPIEKDGIVRGGGLDHNLFLRLQLTF